MKKVINMALEGQDLIKVLTQLCIHCEMKGCRPLSFTVVYGYDPSKEGSVFVSTEALSEGLDEDTLKVRRRMITKRYIGKGE